MAEVSGPYSSIKTVFIHELWQQLQLEDLDFLSTLVQAKLIEMEKLNLEGMKISRQRVKQLHNSYIVLNNGLILRYFHARNKDGLVLHPETDGLVVTDSRNKKVKKLYGLAGHPTHALSLYLDECEFINKETAIERTKVVMKEFAGSPYILKSHYLEWVSATNQIKKQGFVAKCIVPDVFEYCKKIPNSFNFKDLINLCMSISLAIKSMHDKNWAHLDIKPENLLLVQNTKRKPERVYLIDFDTSTLLTHETELSPRGTKGFAADELLEKNCRGVEGGKKADVYSLGITFRDLLTFTKNKIDHPQVNVMDQLTKMMIQKNPFVRPSIDGIIAVLRSL